MRTYNMRVGRLDPTLDAYLLEVRTVVYNFRDMRSMNRCPRQEYLSARPHEHDIHLLLQRTSASLAPFRMNSELGHHLEGVHL